MFISVGNRILNGKRITTIEVDRDTPSEINYYFNDGGMIKEEFKTSEEASERLESLGEDKTFIATNDERLVNAMYIQNVEIDFINKKRVVYYLYGGAPVKELYKTETAAKEALESIKSKLEAMDFGGGSGEGGTVDLTPYLKKTVADETYAKKSEIPSVPTKVSELTNDQDFTTKTYVDGLVGDIESLLGGI